MYEDETLICEDCGKEFVFTAGEQEFFAEKGLTNKPKRCPECRKLKNKHTEERKECLMRFAQNADAKHKFLSILLKAETFFAKNVLKLLKLQVQKHRVKYN